MRKPRRSTAPAVPGLPGEGWSRFPFLVLAAGFAASLAVHLVHLPEWLGSKGSLFINGHLPIMHTADSFLYLRTAGAIASGKIPLSEALLHAPLLPGLAVFLSRVTFAPLEWVAFCMPCLLAAAMAAVYLAWGMELGGPYVALVAALAGPAGYIWMERTDLGDFDTDTLILVLGFLIPYFVLRYAKETGTGRRLVRLAWAVAAALVLSRWWDSNPLFGPCVLVSSYALSIVLPSRAWERALKGLLLLGGLAALLVVLTGAWQRLPQPLAGPLEAVAGNLDVLMKTQESTFADVGQSIEENVSVPLSMVSSWVAGHWLIAVAGAAGLALLMWRRWRECMVLLPLLALGVAGLYSNRLLIFYLPFHALGLGMLLGHELWHNALADRLRPAARLALFVLLAAAALAPGYALNLTTPQTHLFTSKDAQLAQSIAAKTPPGTVIWSWWDYGYFLGYLSDRPTFVDNGTQSPDRVFISAVPLASTDPRFAANWIRFFAAHGTDGLNDTARRLGGTPQAVDFLKKALADPEGLESLLPEAERPRLAEWRSYLFPDIRPVLCLNQSVIDRTIWIFRFGRWDYHARKGDLPYWERHPQADNIIDSRLGTITDRETREYRKARRFIMTDRGLSSKMAEVEVPDDNIVISPSDSKYLYLMTRDTFSMLFYRLLYDDPRSTPGFKPLYYHPLMGGVWQVGE